MNMGGRCLAKAYQSPKSPYCWGWEIAKPEIHLAWKWEQQISRDTAFLTRVFPLDQEVGGTS